MHLDFLKNILPVVLYVTVKKKEKRIGFFFN